VGATLSAIRRPQGRAAPRSGAMTVARSFKAGSPSIQFSASRQRRYECSPAFQGRGHGVYESGVASATLDGSADSTVATRRDGTVLCGPGVETPGYIHGATTWPQENSRRLHPVQSASPKSNLQLSDKLEVCRTYSEPNALLYFSLQHSVPRRILFDNPPG